MVAAPNLGLLLDTWDVVACGGSVETVRKLPAQQIVAVQVADMPAGVPLAELDEKSRLLPGGENGRIDVAGFLAVLRDGGLRRAGHSQALARRFQSRRRDVIIKQTSEALDKVWRAAARRPTARPVLAGADLGTASGGTAPGVEPRRRRIGPHFVSHRRV